MVSQHAAGRCVSVLVHGNLRGGKVCRVVCRVLCRSPFCAAPFCALFGGVLPKAGTAASVGAVDAAAAAGVRLDLALHWLMEAVPSPARWAAVAAATRSWATAQQPRAGDVPLTLFRDANAWWCVPMKKTANPCSKHPILKYSTEEVQLSVCDGSRSCADHIQRRASKSPKRRHSSL